MIARDKRNALALLLELVAANARGLAQQIKQRGTRRDDIARGMRDIQTALARARKALQ